MLRSVFNKTIYKNHCCSWLVRGSLALILTLLLASCSSSISQQHELAASDATMAWMKQEYGLIEEPEIEILLEDVKTRLSRAISESGLTSQKHFGWQVHLVDSPAPNAFSAGGGKVFVTVGLFSLLGSEAELASVISHEFAHQLLDHPGKAIAEMMKLNQASSNGSGTTNSPSLVYSDKHELEADRLGLKIMKLAGYDIRHALTALTNGYKRHGATPSQASRQIIQNAHLDRRLAELFVEVYDNSLLSPARSSSRQFNKAKRKLLR